MKEYRLNLILYLLSLVIMGSNGVVASFINLSSIEIVFMRTVIGSIVLIIVCILTKEKFSSLRNIHDATFLFLSGFALAGGWIFLFAAYRIIGVSIATLLYYLGPIIAMLLSPIFFDEKPTLVTVLGAVVVFTGVVLINGKIVGDPTKWQGIFYGFMSGVLYAVMVIFNKKVKNTSGIENTTCQLVASFVLVFAFLFFSTGINIKIEGSQWIPVIFIGVVNTGLTCFLYYSTITKLPISTVAILSYLDPLSAVLLSALILKESLTIVQVIGAALIIGGAAFSQLYPIYQTIKLKAHSK